jgi:hypothetical protein
MKHNNRVVLFTAHSLVRLISIPLSHSPKSLHIQIYITKEFVWELQTKKKNERTCKYLSR